MNKKKKEEEEEEEEEEMEDPPIASSWFLPGDSLEQNIGRAGVEKRRQCPHQAQGPDDEDDEAGFSHVNASSERMHDRLEAIQRNHH